jgi:uncharacterized membrane protein
MTVFRIVSGPTHETALAAGKDLGRRPKREYYNYLIILLKKNIRLSSDIMEATGSVIKRKCLTLDFR